MHLSQFSFVVILCLPVIAAIGLFAYLAVGSWSRARQREREALYRSELLRKLTEVPAEAAAPVLAALREEDAKALRRRREGLILAGMIWLVVGVAFIGAGHLMGTIHHDGSWALGLIPTFVGAAILFHAAFFAARPPAR
jgi:hypothetical protein